MAFVFVTSACFGCRRLFSYNPNSVPSIKVDGVRQPICQVCVDHVNPARKRNGLPPIRPLPGAYEPVDETEIIWE